MPTKKKAVKKAVKAVKKTTKKVAKKVAQKASDLTDAEQRDLRRAALKKLGLI